MGVDLTLMPVAYSNVCISLDLWFLERREGLWTEIESLKERPVPHPPVVCYVARGDDGEPPRYGDLHETPYGDKLTYLTAGELVKLKDSEHVQDNWKNKGIWKMLEEMPSDWPVVLYWH